ncbi:MAG TPA: carbohydrate kinase family protein [Verrucomicrobiae bacterium]|nr:carbohydrate kinase family protein [Verrucomicrobiae bacterium]
MATVHCIGALVVDALSGPLPQYPIPRVKPQINTSSIRFLPGGGAANTGSALAQMGVSVRIFSKVGRDLNGSFLRRELARKGVDVSHVRVSPKENTPFTFVGMGPDGERSFIHTPGTNLTLSRRDLALDPLFHCRFLLYQDLWVLPRLDGPAAPKLLATAQKRGVTTLLDECFGLGPNRKIFEAALPYCDVILPSYEDLGCIYPGVEPADMARKLRAKGACRVVLKLGRRGCLVATEKETALVPSMAKMIVDGTGAGDCFNAGFIAGLAHGLNDVAAAKVGSAAAAACLRNVGGAVGIPKYDTLLRRSR